MSFKLPTHESNARSLAEYERKLHAARRKMDQSFRRLGRAMNVMIRARNRVVYLEGQIEGVQQAIERNEPFRKPRPKKVKGVRAIEL